MIAHPERCRLFDLPPSTPGRFRKICHGINRSLNLKPRTLNIDAQILNSLLSYLLDLGCAFQGNIRSFSGGYGQQVKLRADKLRERGIYTHFGTDAHSAEQLKEIKLLTH